MSTATEATNDRASAAESPLDELLTKQSASRELMAMKVENETIMAECRVRPRDMAAIKAQLAGLLLNFPEFADDAIYSKDVGGGKIAEDLSVRAAEALAEAYGWNRIRADVTPVDADTVKVEATFTDFQSGRIWQDAVIVSKWYTISKTKGGGRARHADDRFNDTVAKAAKSKVIREVICRSVNPALKAWFKNECYKVMAQSVKPEDADKIVEAWKGIGVTLQKLEQLIGKPRSMGWLVSDQLKLRTLYVAVRDGEQSIESLLNSGEESSMPKTAAELTKQLTGKTETPKPMTDEERFEMEAKQ